mmetsp:Transcript_151008/g.263113  ORF Transcript_151008/g.263113 Transcript_151008/m.263113 type:complete len:232 (-) Transcript_151008:491-1186(-)
MRSAFSFSSARLSCNWSSSSATDASAALPLLGAAGIAPTMLVRLSGMGTSCDRSSCSNMASLDLASASAWSRFSSSSFSSSADRSWFTLTTFLIFLARCPKRKVLKVSCSLKLDGEHVMIKEVLALPPRDSCSTRVSFESRYGTCVYFLSVSALMTLPKAERDRFIFFASSNRSPEAPVLATFSLPARSTKWSFPTLTERSCRFFCSIVSMKTRCDREECSFMLVTAIERL